MKMNHCVDIKVLDELPSGLAFWNIVNSASEWTQGGQVELSSSSEEEKVEVKEKEKNKNV